MLKNRLFLVLTLLVAAAMILGACGQATPPRPRADEPPPPEPTAVPPPSSAGLTREAHHHGPGPSATTQELGAGVTPSRQAFRADRLHHHHHHPDVLRGLVEAMGSGNAHIGWLPPLAYVLASQKGYADVVYVAIARARITTARSTWRTWTAA